MSTATQDVEITTGDDTAIPVEHKPAPKRESATKPKMLPPYAVMLHDDDINTMEFVIETLQRVFGYDLHKAAILMLEAHNHGQSLVWSGAKEHAEFKADQILSRGADPVMRDKGAQPLRVTIEPMA